ncbi:tRNA pseudouridine synthase [Lentinus brumalis]|uniref:tRNA pseudouridine synthase n=1 Tax=Lentinus brumalis TaxID=2498619 RepID=A0A371CTQ5_9APHY|nr:tRNA pseudouridine synthase [Polyporus brumalis]
MPGGFSYRLLRPYARFTRMEPYKNWSREELIARLQHLDPHHDRPRPATTPQGKPFDFNAYPKRKIALKFTYNGIHYGGMEFQRDPALPTVEGVLFDALVHTRLVDRAGGLEGCGWQRCGRTDKGVSAGGQVVSLWVRSTLGSKAAEEAVPTELESTASAEPSEDGPGLEGDFGLMDDFDEAPTNNSKPTEPASAALEFPYVFGLNHVLPPTIRVLAWSPVSDEFSARFSCRWRHYKYFFSPRGLDLAAMSDAAARLVGERDFRNLCKIDASKQITVFTRRILSATIDRADAHGDLYVFNLRGNAFLYNMVRHIMAILFLVGSGLEKPSVMTALLNADPANPLPPFREGEEPPPIVTGKPDYLIADPLPLMLWDCGYDDGVLDWRTDRASAKTGESTKSPLPGMICDLERATITAALDEHFLKAAEAHHKPPKQYFPLGAPDVEPLHPGAMMSVPLGGGMVKRAGTYVPLLQRKRMPTPDEVNERYRLGRGAKKLGRKAAPTTADEGDE